MLACIGPCVRAQVEVCGCFLGGFARLFMRRKKPLDCCSGAPKVYKQHGRVEHNQGGIHWTSKAVPLVEPGEKNATLPNYRSYKLLLLRTCAPQTPGRNTATRKIQLADKDTAACSKDWNIEMTSNKLLPQTALGHKVMAMFRAPLAAAVQWSSPTPSRPSAEGAVGRVYSSAGQHTTGGRPGAPAAYACGAAQNLQAAPPSAAPQAQQPAKAPNSERGAETEREMERLRKDLRKTEEKANFFRNQVLTLQRQVRL